MSALHPILKHIVAAFSLTVMIALPAHGQEADLDALFEQLSKPDTQNWQEVEDRIWAEWSRSGSPAMDLLLKRGRDALEAGKVEAAIGHLTALTDHAPEFAEGYNARAMAYFEAGLYGPTLADIGRVLELNPRHFGAMTGLAVILEETGYPEAALAAYRDVLAIHPHIPDVTTAIERLEKKVEGRKL